MKSCADQAAVACLHDIICACTLRWLSHTGIMLSCLLAPWMVDGLGLCICSLLPLSWSSRRCQDQQEVRHLMLALWL